MALHSDLAVYDPAGGQKRFPGCARAGEGLIGATESIPPVVLLNYPTPRADELSLGGPGRRQPSARRSWSAGGSVQSFSLW